MRFQSQTKEPKGLTMKVDDFTKRLSVYSSQGPGNTTKVDTTLMIVDLVTIFKAGSVTKEQLKAEIDKVWDVVEVTIKNPLQKSQ